MVVDKFFDVFRKVKPQEDREEKKEEEIKYEGYKILKYPKEKESQKEGFKVFIYKIGEYEDAKEVIKILKEYDNNNFVILIDYTLLYKKDEKDFERVVNLLKRFTQPRNMNIALLRNLEAKMLVIWDNNIVNIYNYINEMSQMQ